MALSDSERAVIDFERTWWTRPGPKERAIRDVLDMSPSAYYRALASVLDDSEAMAYDPLVIRRVRRTREQRRQARFAGRPAESPRNP